LQSGRQEGCIRALNSSESKTLTICLISGAREALQEITAVQICSDRQTKESTDICCRCSIGEGYPERKEKLKWIAIW
jgi:hypothetical protein